jgi:hypothetical protein
MLFIKQLLYRLAYEILGREIDREVGKYEVRNCVHGFECHLRGGIDSKVKTRRFFPDIDDEDMTYQQASCDLCHMAVRVEHKWEQIQVSIYMNRAFIVNRSEIEPDEWRENRRKMREKIGRPQVSYPLIPKQGDSREYPDFIKKAEKPLEEIRLALISSHSGEGYGDQRKAAEIAVKNFGSDWTRKFPETDEGKALRQKLRTLAIETTPKWHSNGYVIWKRLQDRAKEIKS